MRISDWSSDVCSSDLLFGEINRDTRGRAKTINFSILYGISRWGLGARLEIVPDGAHEMIHRYFERFPGISHYITHTLEAAQETGYTQTLFGRKKWFPRLPAKSQAERLVSYVADLHHPIYGPSAGL